MEQKIEAGAAGKPYISAVSIFDLTDRDLYWLTKACGVGYNGYNTSDMLKQAVGGYIRICRIKSADAEGIFTLRVLTHPNGKELQIECVAGKGLIKIASEVFEEIKEVAQEYGCRFIQAEADNKALERLYSKLLKPTLKRTKLIMEI